MSDGTRQSVQSIARACALLEALAREPSAPLSRLSQATGLHPASAHRILRTLEEQGYVYHGASGGPYHLGPNLMWLGRRAAVHFPFREATRAEMRVLVGECGETVYTAILRDGDVLYVDVVESPHTIRLTSHVGDRYPAYLSATGRVLLGYVSPEELRSYLHRELQPSTEHTITDPAQLEEIIRVGVQKGFCIVAEEAEIGVTSVAAAIRGHDSDAIAALAISGPSYRMQERMEELSHMVMRYAGRLSLTLGGHDDSATRDESFNPSFRLAHH
jgi:DNA-binding IclR family transcriptional regulator